MFVYVSEGYNQGLDTKSNNFPSRVCLGLVHLKTLPTHEFQNSVKRILVCKLRGWMEKSDKP
jgi:hypothetical protein